MDSREGRDRRGDTCSLACRITRQGYSLATHRLGSRATATTSQEGEGSGVAARVTHQFPECSSSDDRSGNGSNGINSRRRGSSGGGGRSN